MTLLLLFVAVAFGCGERNSAPKLHESNLRVVAVLYSQFVSAHGVKFPAMRRFRALYNRWPGSARTGRIVWLDELLLSRRDGKPFAIIQDVDWNSVIAYEQDGAWHALHRSDLAPCPRSPRNSSRADSRIVVVGRNEERNKA